MSHRAASWIKECSKNNPHSLKTFLRAPPIPTLEQEMRQYGQGPTILSLRVAMPQTSSVPNDTILRVRWHLRSLAPTRDVPGGRLSFDGVLSRTVGRVCAPRCKGGIASVGPALLLASDPCAT